MVLEITAGAAGTDVATRLWLCSQGSGLCVNCLIACGRVKVMWFSLVGLSWYVACAMVLGLSVLFPSVAFARPVGGIFGWFCLCTGRGLDFIWLVCLFQVVGLVLVCLSYARDMGLVLLGLFASWHMFVLYRADAPFLCL